MASKARRMVKSGKALMGKITHPPYIKTTIPSGKAVAAPPLGPQLGQVTPQPRELSSKHFLPRDVG